MMNKDEIDFHVSPISEKSLRPSLTNEATNISLEIICFLGSLLILSGIFVYIIRFWSEISSSSRILMSFGMGISGYVMAILFLENIHLKRMASFLVFTAAYFEYFGGFVVLKEYNLIEYDSLIPTILISGCLCVQQILILQRKPNGVLLFLSLNFGIIFLSYLFKYLYLPDKYNLIVVGLSLFTIINASSFNFYQKNRVFWDFVSTLLVLQGFFEFMKGTSFEIILVALCCGIIYLSTIYKSKGLLVAGSAYLFWYIVYYALNHYYKSDNLSFILIIFGIILMALSVLSLQINKRFLKI